jgi:hypothetical protein
MDFHLNMMQDALTISENRANTIQMRLAEAEARITGEISYGDSYLHNPDFTYYDAQSINVRGAVLVVRLHDVPNHAREINLHGVHHGAAVTLAVAQVHSRYELRLLPHGFPAADHPEDHENLVEDFSNAANTIAFSSLAEDIVNKVFLIP